MDIFARLLYLEFIVLTLDVFQDFVSSSEVYTISRQTNSANDVFTLPPTTCQLSSCSDYYGESPVNCECSCPSSSTTFSFYERKWSCVLNSNIRELAGCGHYLDMYGSSSDALRVLKVDKRYDIYLTADTCKLDLSTSQYLHCDGTWRQLQINSDLFTLKYKQTLSTGTVSNKKYHFKIKTQFPSDMRGQILRLSLRTCEITTGSSCITFKVEGQQSCPVSFSTTSTLSRQATTVLPSIMSLTSPTTLVTPSTPTTLIGRTSTKTTSFSTTITAAKRSLTLPLPTPTRSFLSSSPSMTVNATPRATTKNLTMGNNGAHKGDSGPSTGLMAGLLTGFLLLVLLAIILVGYIIWKRRRGQEIKMVKRFNNAVASGVARFRYIRNTQRKAKETDGNEDPATTSQGGEYNYAYDGPQVTDHRTDDSVYEEIDVTSCPPRSLAREGQANDDGDNDSNHPSDWSDWSDDLYDNEEVEVVERTRVNVGQLQTAPEQHATQEDVYEVPNDSPRKTYMENASQDVNNVQTQIPDSQDFYEEPSDSWVAKATNHGRDNEAADENNKEPPLYHVLENQEEITNSEHVTCDLDGYEVPIDSWRKKRKDNLTAGSDLSMATINEQPLHHVLEQNQNDSMHNTENSASKPPIPRKPILAKLWKGKNSSSYA